MLLLTLALIMGGGGIVALFVDLVVLVCLALLAWYVVQRFSPDPLLTKILGIFLFLIVFIVVIADIFPGSVNIH
jgi:hypothetical protein